MLPNSMSMSVKAGLRSSLAIHRGKSKKKRDVGFGDFGSSQRAP